MNGIQRAIGNWFQYGGREWNRFWFTPAEPHTLSAIRVFAGAMLFYTHLVWSFDLLAFLGKDSWVPGPVVREMHREASSLSYLWYVESPWLLWVLHIGALIVFALLTIGLFTRVMSVLAALITLSYCHRLTGTLFGLDQINAMLAIYLVVGPAGAVYSVDRWLARRRAGERSPGERKPQQWNLQPSVATNIAVRLIQLHLCVIYLFGGIGKMRGEMWWDGSAVWFALANYEYQSIDLTWIEPYRWLIALLTHITVFWETFYPILIWPRFTRPIALMMAVMVHGGIALFLGMPTFGIAMLIANMAFLDPAFVDAVVAFPRRYFVRQPQLSPA